MRRRDKVVQRVLKRLAQDAATTNQNGKLRAKAPTINHTTSCLVFTKSNNFSNNRGFKQLIVK